MPFAANPIGPVSWLEVIGYVAIIPIIIFLTFCIIFTFIKWMVWLWGGTED